MSGDGRTTPDRRGGEAQTGYDWGDFDTLVRQFAFAFGLKEVEYVAQIPDDKEDVVLWEIWESKGEGSLQVRSTWRRRVLPEETKEQQPQTSDVRQPNEGHGQNNRERNQPSDRRGDESEGVGKAEV